jgi:hypothetical protein
MKRSERPPDADDDMLPEYDLRGGIRGKYFRRYHGGGCVVVLDPDVAEKFQDSQSVNAALRALLKDRPDR